jgi:acyl-CoA thioesterase-1
VTRRVEAWKVFTAMTEDIRICFIGDSFVNGTGDDTALGWVGRVCAAARGRGVGLTAYSLGIRRDTSVDVLARCEREWSRRLPAGIDGRIVLSFGVNDTVIEDGGAGGRLKGEPGAGGPGPPIEIHWRLRRGRTAAQPTAGESGGGAPRQRVTTAESCEAFRRIVEAATAAVGGARRVLFVGPPPVAEDDHNARIERLAAALFAEADRSGVLHLDLFTPLVADEEYRREIANGDGAHPTAAGYARIAEHVMASPNWWFH